MIHLSNYIYKNIINLPKEHKKRIVNETVMTAARTALAVLAAAIVKDLKLGLMGLSVAILVGAELSVPITLMAGGFIFSYQLFQMVFTDLSRDFPTKVNANFAFASMIGFIPQPLTALLPQMPELSIGYLEDYVIRPLGDKIANYLID